MYLIEYVGEKCFLLRTIESVSYTHLDVYKRQVFNDADTIAVEKLDGTNVKIFTIDGRLVAIQNRKNIIDPQLIVGGQTFVIEGIVQSATSAFKGYVNANGEQCGELLGPKLNGNRYNLDGHIWYPFDKAIQHLSLIHI